MVPRRRDGVIHLTNTQELPTLRPLRMLRRRCVFFFFFKLATYIEAVMKKKLSCLGLGFGERSRLQKATNLIVGLERQLRLGSNTATWHSGAYTVSHTMKSLSKDDPRQSWKTRCFRSSYHLETKSNDLNERQKEYYLFNESSGLSDCYTKVWVLINSKALFVPSVDAMFQYLVEAEVLADQGLD